MRSAAREDFVPDSPGRDPQNSTGDTDVRDNDKDKGTHAHQGAFCEGPKLTDGSVRAGEL